MEIETLRREICARIARHDYPPIGLDEALTLKLCREWLQANNGCLEYDFFPGRKAKKHQATIYLGETEASLEDADRPAEAIALAWLGALKSRKDAA